MNLDDSFTEKLIQRNKVRKEYINEKRTDIFSTGKKRAALDEQQINYGSTDIPAEESPKRQCTQAAQSAYSPHDKENIQMEDADMNAAFVPFHSASKGKGLAALKKNFINGDDEVPRTKVTSESQHTPATVKYPTKSPTKTSGGIMKQDPNLKKESSAEEECSDDDENDFAENYDEICSEPESVKMELDYSPIKPVKKNENIDVEARPGIVNKTVAQVIDKPIDPNVDPAELPLHARKALFEKALLGGTPKINEDVIDHKLSVAQRAAMFESASKVKTGPVTTAHFKEPKRIALSNFSKFDTAKSSQMAKSPVKAVQLSNSQTVISIAEAFQTGNNQIAKSPVKTFQELNSHIMKSPVKPNLTISKGSPAKKVIAASPTKRVISPPTSTPSPTKNIGNHTRLIQQKLMENSGSSLQGKEIAAKAAQERKQENFRLDNHREKLSSSSVETNSEVERINLASEENISCESDAVPEPSEYGEESNSEISEEEYRDDVDEEEKDADCSDLESDIAENVFELRDSEIESLKSLEEDCNSETNSWQREYTQSTSSRNTQSVISSLSGYSGISSYSDDSNYNASRSQSCASDSSARSYEVASSSATNSTSVSSKDCKNPDVPLLYTVSFYRKQKQETRLTPPVRTIVRREQVISPDSSDTDYTEIIQERLKAFQEEILRQQTVISQTSQALNLCSATAEFSGSTEQVEGERLLLIATQKRQACLNEISRLKTCGAQGENVTDGKGTLIITDMQLPLKREFMASQLEGRGTDTVHYFLCLIRHGAQVIVTQMMSTEDKVSDGALCFTNHIKLQNLPADFSVVFEVYALQTKKEVLPHEKKYHIKREHSKIRLTPKGRKSDGKILRPAISSPGGPSAVRSPSFGVVGYTRFNLQNCNKKTFTLDKVPFASPLDGVLRVKLQLHAEHKVIEKGFLTMFEDVSGFGAWHRRWCALDSHHLAYWKYPDDEHKKEPIGVIDLKQCVTGQVKLVSRDVCARPHTFQLLIVRPQAKGDKNTLISRSINTLTTTKHLLSADTKDERILWCNKLNEALTNSRKWDPHALRPIESMQD